MNLQNELRIYLDTLVITSENIGEIRSSLFVPWTSAWNGLVRDETAARERQSAAPLPASAALRALIAKWRAEAAAEQRVSFCADELEAALLGIAIPTEVKD